MKDPEKVMTFKANELHRESCLENADCGIQFKGEEMLAVCGDMILRGDFLKGKVDDAVGIDDDGAVGEAVGANGVDDNRIQVRSENGAAGAERISRGAGGAGDDNAVGIIAVHGFSVDLNLAADHAGCIAFADDNIIQSIEAELPIRVLNLRFKYHPLFNIIIAVQKLEYLLLIIVPRELGKKTQIAQMKTEQRCHAVMDFSNGGQQGAVSAETDDDITFPDKVIRLADSVMGLRRLQYIEKPWLNEEIRVLVLHPEREFLKDGQNLLLLVEIGNNTDFHSSSALPSDGVSLRLSDRTEIFSLVS